MAYIPHDAKWYLADIILEIRVEGDSRNVVHTNTMLIRADSPEEAYENAMRLGRAEEISYENPEGRAVTIRFRGLQGLSVIHDDLEHGAELSFNERIGMSEAEIVGLIPAKERLSVFAPRRRSGGPDYSSGDVVRELHRQFPGLDPDPTRW